MSSSLKSEVADLCVIFPRFTGPYGAERHALRLSSELSDLGFKITIFTHRVEKGCAPLLANSNVRIVETGFPPIGDHDLASLLDLILMPNLAFKVRGRYKTIHAIGWQSMFGAAILRVFRYPNTPIIYHCIDPPRFIYDLRGMTLSRLPHHKRWLLRIITPLIQHLDRWEVGLADVIVANSDLTHARVSDIYRRDSKIVYPGVEVERFSKYSKKDARKMLGIPLDATVFLSVSKLHRRKKIDDALRIYEDVSRGKKSYFFIIGNGPDRSRLEKIASEMGLSNVKFLGVLTDEIVAMYYAAADYFIFTAKDEAFGIAPMEAKVAGCNVIPRSPTYPIITWRDHAKQISKIIEEVLNEGA